MHQASAAIHAPRMLLGLLGRRVELRARRPEVSAASAAIGMGDDTQPMDKSNNSLIDSLFTSEFDREIASVALPSLCGMLLEPIMGVINSGERLTDVHGPHQASGEKGGTSRA